jgi:hypothetical protein
MIDLVPIAGLCNRMRTMDAALELSTRLHTRLRVHWMPTPDLNCPFHRLFRPIPGVELIEGMRRPSRLAVRFGKHHALMALAGRLADTVYYYWDENERLEQDAAQLTPLQVNRHIHIISYWRFLDRKERFSEFRPIPELQDRIDSVSHSFDEHTVGVHIRRTDNVKAIAHSPVHLFEQAMDRAVEMEPRTRFFLATDSADTKAEMIHRFGERIITPSGHADRLSIQGIQDAVVELYCLSRTTKLFGSFFSSYSRTAAEIGRIEEVTIR